MIAAGSRGSFGGRRLVPGSPRNSHKWPVYSGLLYKDIDVKGAAPSFHLTAAAPGSRSGVVPVISAPVVTEDVRLRLSPQTGDGPESVAEPLDGSTPPAESDRRTLPTPPAATRSDTWREGYIDRWETTSRVNRLASVPPRPERRRFRSLSAAHVIRCHQPMKVLDPTYKIAILGSLHVGPQKPLIDPIGQIPETDPLPGLARPLRFQPLLGPLELVFAHR